MQNNKVSFAELIKCKKIYKHLKIRKEITFNNCRCRYARCILLMHKIHYYWNNFSIIPEDYLIITMLIVQRVVYEVQIHSPRSVK